MTTEIENVIETIATNLGIAVEQIFGVFTSAQPMVGILNFMSLVITISVAYFVYRSCLKALKNMHEKMNCDDLVMIYSLSIIASGFSFLVLMIVMEIISEGALMIVCPEYMAMKEIVSLMQGV